MKVYFYAVKNQIITSTILLLKYLLRKYNVGIVMNPDEADFIFVSMNDMAYFSVLRSAYKKFKGIKPIVVGGDVAKLDFVLIYADYAVRGEAYNFIREFSKLDKIEDIENIENVTSKNKKGIVDYRIDYELNPIIKSTKKVYYYYGGKGCTAQCKFCFYSHVNKYSKVGKDYIIRAIKTIPNNARLHVTSAFFPYPDMEDKYLKKLGMIDLRINQYIKRHYPSRTFGIGIEFFSEEMRKYMRKPIKNELVKELIDLSFKRNHDIIMYFIVGLEDESAIYDFVEQVPYYQKSYSPRILLNTQYIDFNQKTPIGNVDVRVKKDFNYRILQKELNLKNRRFRVRRTKYKSYSTYRTLIQRTSNMEESEFVYSLRNDKNNDDVVEKVLKKYPHLIGSDRLFNESK